MELNWDRGWVGRLAQEEGNRLRAREWEQRQVLLAWHVGTLEHSARGKVLRPGALERQGLQGRARRGHDWRKWHGPGRGHDAPSNTGSSSQEGDAGAGGTRTMGTQTMQAQNSDSPSEPLWSPPAKKDGTRDRAPGLVKEEKRRSSA